MSKRKASHTPGPWQLGRRYGNNRTEVLNTTGGRAVATVWTHERRSGSKRPEGEDDYAELPEGIANAALIAAAPDLLDACAALCALAFDLGRSEAATGVDHAKARAAFTAAHAAIAKARGT